MIVLLLGSGLPALRAAHWPRSRFDRIVAINNAWRVRPDWDDMIHPWDFPADRLPDPGPGQRLITEDDFVPAQNAQGGFVYGGATMAFTAAYWVLEALKPRVIALMGCDMVYPSTGPTHFYGTGTPDPLRPDITLRSLEAKSARLRILAARRGTAVVNLSTGPTRLALPRATPAGLPNCRPLPVWNMIADQAIARETALGYTTPSGRYWEELSRFNLAEIDRLDALWLAAGQIPAARRQR